MNLACKYLNKNLKATCFALNRAQCLQDVMLFRNQKKADYCCSVVDRLNLHLSFLTYKQGFHLPGHHKPLLNGNILLIGPICIFLQLSSITSAQQTLKSSRMSAILTTLFCVAVEIVRSTSKLPVLAVIPSNTSHFLKTFAC